ncbi:hypothetical protein [Tunturibacter empetritectus]|uniref:Uncharacterized protein n=1 Tax=Tunturiibacter lichenicola TaxID=2051959 RepID=A0A7W8N5D2_9BACT|nr:hypothetical protein [Edaphobacter lichenicola]MBB5344461.1 hypothetical protein [Edaphobacter lichenicola]
MKHLEVLLLAIGLCHPPENPFCAYGQQSSVLPDLCATDPIYRAFERVQAEAYRSDSGLAFQFLLDKKLQQENWRNVQKRLDDARTHYGVSKSYLEGGITDLTSSKDIPLPTCYENPLLFIMLYQYASDIELARRALHLPLSHPMRFGSLPSNDINAYTYVFSDTREEVVAINYELSPFIYHMTELAATISHLSQITGDRSDSELVTQALLSMAHNPEAKKTFTETLSSFVLGKPVREPQISPDDFMLVISFAAGMERFVYAHEYAHVILGHVSSSEFIPLGATGDSEHVVLLRTWRQEMDADALGYKLLLHAMAGAESQDLDKKFSEYYRFASMGPLFFLDCLELLDDARIIQETGELPHELSEKEKRALRSCTNQALAESPECLVLVRDTHPPAWLRREVLARVVQQEMHPDHNSKVAKARAAAMTYGINILYKQSLNALYNNLLADSRAAASYQPLVR